MRWWRAAGAEAVDARLIAAENRLLLEGKIGTRFRTGETCLESGRYQFDSYTDGTSQPPPLSAEREIPISRGEKFPPIRSSAKACYWKFMQRI